MSAKQKIPVVYVAGPYRAATRELIAENIAVARSVAVATARIGWFPLCPHTNTAHFDEDLPGQDQFFLDGTLALMERCDAVVLVNGWRYSAGTLGEVHRARELGMPIFACLEDLPTAEEFAEQPAPNYNRKPIAIDDQVRARLALVAREAAISSAHRYSYMPTTPEDALLWEPHAWVIDAMRMVEQPAPVAVSSRDESIAWLKRIDGVGQARAELIYSMGFRRHTEVPQS